MTSETAVSHLADSPRSIAYADGCIVRLAVLLACPYCEHSLRAHDVEIIGDDVRLVCAWCHSDILAIERR